MIRFLRGRTKRIAVFLIVTFVLQIISVPTSWALTSGPTQPEVLAFSPATSTDMVDLFSGDFSYNIPLFELPGPNGGYPFNLSYQAGITMDQEASWVGLGWTLQPGAITRQMRGLPDEFNGDLVTTKMSIEPNVTAGIGAGVGAEFFGGALDIGLGLSVYKNSYKGAGYSIDGSVGFSSAAGGMSGGIGLGFSLDSQEGVGLNPSLNLGGETGYFGLSAAYNSKQGLTSITAREPTEGLAATSGDASATLSLAHPSYTPQVSMPMRNSSVSATFRAGADWWGIFPSAYINGFYNEQRLDKEKKLLTTKGYGYLNYQSATVKDLLDYNREKDGIVFKESPNMAVPSQTYDIYSVTGQGIGMMYRPMRNDFGIIYDQETTSVSNSLGVGADIGPIASHVGANLSLNHSKSTSGKWTDNNGLTSYGEFQKKNAGELYEPWYFKVHGEQSIENETSYKSIGGDKAVRVKLNSNLNNFIVSATTSLDGNVTGTLSAPTSTDRSQPRKPRAHSIVPIKNSELLNSSNQEVLKHFKARYINASGTEGDFIRTGLPADHFAGYTAINAEGLRYVYAIPAYNLEQEEVTFSVAQQASARVNVGSNGQGDPSYEATGTDKFLKKTILPKYAHSYLLTAILGPDYVDVDDNGVSEKDLGYWVKFIYQKTTTDTEPYQWRDPFSQAHHDMGWRSDPRDDKGSFVYGKKELWYLARAETKTHIAKFTTVAREDAYGVAAKLQDTNARGLVTSYKLQDISLYTRSGGSTKPIKTVKFTHSYALCSGVYNNINGGGKLTLTQVKFEYGGIVRAAGKSPFTYEFAYKAGPSYGVNQYDRWGTYKPAPDALFNLDYPYAEQDSLQINTINANAAAWSLSEITLPSGGKIFVDYETDDYGYVQQKTAMQMVALVDPYTTLPGGTLQSSYEVNKPRADPQDDYKIRFKLEKSLPANFPAAQFASEVMKYLDKESGQLYFKNWTRLLKPAKAEFSEYVTGYAEIDFTKAMILEQQVLGGDFLYGSFYVKREEPKANQYKHPFALKAWQHLRSNQPELANGTDGVGPATNVGQKISMMRGLAGIVSNVRQMFEGYYNYCDGQDWGKRIDATKSWIRLNSPDRIKYGGGLRVKQITMKDLWAQDDEGVYGQVYNYRMREGGRTISSGVAAYEPVVGGDENALHYAKKYNQSIPMRSDNNMLIEYPLNESAYPGPQVGYRKVTVMSLPSAAAAGKPITATANLPDGQPLLPTGVNFGTSGMTVHEFYTAKDFPILTDETEKMNKQFRLSVPVPLMGNVSISKLTASQGYSIVTNDMHGKQKKVSTYRQNKSGTFESEPISWVKYNYLSQLKYVNKENVSALTNTLKDNQDGTLSIPTPAELTNGSIPKVHFGQEVEFFHDMRQYEDNAWGGGARGNLDIVYVPLLFVVVPIPVITGFPNVSKSNSQLRTSVTNKVVFKSGILESVEAYDGGSIVKTQNLKWDKLTGATVLTSVNNNFENKVYSYSIPAYLEYQGMGAAYQNLGLTFTMTSVQKDPIRNDLYNFYAALPASTLQPGDEILLYDVASDFSTPITRVIYTGNNEGDDVIYTGQALAAPTYKAMIVRSGYRNQLTIMAGTISALQDPSIAGSNTIYTKTISVPK